MRYAACVEYDGSQFNGWQVQKHNARTVQHTVEQALGRVADHDLGVVTAGRTDTGVHASHQVIHFDTEVERSDYAWCRGANRFLPGDVRLLWVTAVDAEFHARFSAFSRSYRFIIINRPVASALYQHKATHEYRPLQPHLMQQAAQCLLGKQDFSSFRAAGCQAKSPVREVLSFNLQHHGDWIWFDITANAFLQHMVRNIAGSLITVGCGDQPVEWLGEVLRQTDRTKAGITASANGLYLIGVDYADSYALPSKRRSVSYWGD